MATAEVTERQAADNVTKPFRRQRPVTSLNCPTAEAGCSTKQIQAISGHATLKEVEREALRQLAEQKRLAAAAMSTINEQNWLTDESGSPKSSGKVLKEKGNKPC
jgi:hypothetical protein